MKLKKVLSVFLALTFIFSLNVMSATQPTLQKIFKDIFSVGASAIEDAIMKYAPAGTEDLALKASVTASSCYYSADGKWHLDRINDGEFRFNGVDAGFSTSTTEVAYNDNMTEEQKQAAVNESKNKEFTMTFDLEGFYNISRIAMFKFGAFPDTFELQVSVDGEEYKTVASESGYAGYNKEALVFNFETERVRFVRLYVTKRGNLDGNNIHFVQLNEIGIYGTPAAPTNTDLDINSYAPEHCINLAPESTITAPGSYESGDGLWGVENLNDGDASRNGGFTIFANNASNIDFNLGSIADVKRVVIFPNGVAPKTVEIRTSYDGVNYKTVKTVTIPESVYQHNGNTADENKVLNYFTFDLPENTFASHVQLLVTERFAAGDNMVQCAEIAVYGVKNIFEAKLTKPSINLLLNDTLTLEWQTKRQNTYLGYEHKIEWSSKDESVATVDKNTGLVTAKAIGKTKVVATNTLLGCSAEVDVNVCEKLPYKRDNITISAFSPPTGKLFTNEHYATVAAADIDLLINSYNVTSVEDNLKMLEFARNNGMNSIVADSRFWNVKENVPKELAEEVYQDYKGISNLEGVYLFDEPWNPNIYAESAKNLAEVMPRSFVYLNFFPGYIYNSFEQYEYTYDDLAALTDGKVDLMFDVYPFMADGSTNYNYLFNCLESIRRSGLKYDINTAACMQTHGYGPANGNLTHRDPSFTDMRYQGMTYLAYGIKHLSYWKYSSSASVGTEKHNLGAIDLDGNTTPVYDRMKAVNPILHTVGEKVYNCDAREVYITGANLYGQKTVPSTFFVQPGNASQNLVFSYLRDKDTGRNYLMVVNSDLANTVTVPLKFASGINYIEVLDNYTGSWSGASINGNYSVTLEAGDAALIALPENYRYEEAAAAAGTNPAYHKTVYGNSSLGTPGTRDDKLPGWYLSCLTDGYTDANPTQGLNGWCSELKDASFETYVKVDLGEEKYISTLSLYAVSQSTGYADYFPKAYTVSVSTDGTSWTPVAAEINANVAGSVTYNFDSIAARYIKVDITEMNAIDGKYAAAISEIEINGKPQIVRYKVVADGTRGIYAYMYCDNTTYVRTPSWTDYNGRDDLIWHEGESGNWTINGFKYNFRTFIPVSEHNNEYGTYTIHLYAYNDTDETSRGTAFTFGSTALFDYNYDDVQKNLIIGLDTIGEGSGITARYDASDDTITLNGTLSSSVEIKTGIPFNEDIRKGDIIRVTVEDVSGTMTDATLVTEFYNDGMKAPGGIRTFVDMYTPGTYNITVKTDSVADEVSSFNFWIYKSERTTVFDNFKFRLKVEVAKGDYAYSPSGKAVGYNESFGTLPIPETREDYDFIGWFTEPTGGEQVTASTVNKAVSAITLYAQWKEKEVDFFYGVHPGIIAEELEKDYLSFENAVYEYSNVNDTEHLGTGTLITVKDKTTGDKLAKYRLVIFGDVNGDGWYDGQDAVYVDAIFNKMLTADDIGSAKMRAADCNHDGVVDVLDHRILRDAGLLLKNVNQTLPTQELMTTAEWQAYSAVIDQEPEIVEPESPEQPVEPEEPQEDVCFIVKFFRRIINFFEKVFSFIF